MKRFVTKTKVYHIYAQKSESNEHVNLGCHDFQKEVK